MMKTTVAKIPVLSEKSALSIFGRVLSGDIKVCIGEIVDTDPVHRAEPRWTPDWNRATYDSIISASLDEHDLFTEQSRGGRRCHLDLTRLGFARRAVLYTERSRGGGLCIFKI
jgi:hypothetical protein